LIYYSKLIEEIRISLKTKRQETAKTKKPSRAILVFY